MKKFVRKGNLEEQKLALRAEYDFIIRGAFRMLNEESLSKEDKIKMLQREYYQIAGEDVQRNELFYERLDKIKLELQEKTKKKVNQHFFDVLGLFLDAGTLDQAEHDELKNFQKTTKVVPLANSKSTKGLEHCWPKLMAFESERDKIDKNREITSQLIEFMKSKTEDENTLKIKREGLEFVWKEIYSKVNFAGLYESCEVGFSIYGSFVNQFSIQASDIDVSLDMLDYDDYDEKKVLRFLQSNIPKPLQNSPEIKIIPPEDSMRIPVLEVELKKYNLVISFSVNNVLGAVNSRMIKTYSEIDSRCRMLGILVKLWAGVHNLTSAKRNYLSSYAYNLMVINYLQTMKNPILPSLQEIRKDDTNPEMREVRQQDKKSDKPAKYKVRIDYEDDLEVIKKYMMEDPKFKENKKTTIQLLKGFFKFYKNRRKFEGKTLSVKEGRLRDRTEDEKKYLYSIEDPFDKYHNPGKYLTATHFNVDAMLRCMKHSYRLLKEKQVMDIFKPFDDDD